MAKDKGRFRDGHDEMIGKGDFANMPQDVMMSEYPKVRHGSGDMDDTITGIDEVQDEGAARRNRFISNQK